MTLWKCLFMAAPQPGNKSQQCLQCKIVFPFLNLKRACGDKKGVCLPACMSAYRYVCCCFVRVFGSFSRSRVEFWPFSFLLQHNFHPSLVWNDSLSGRHGNKDIQIKGDGIPSECCCIVLSIVPGGGRTMRHTLSMPPTET